MRNRFSIRYLPILVLFLMNSNCSIGVLSPNNDKTKDELITKTKLSNQSEDELKQSAPKPAGSSTTKDSKPAIFEDQSKYFDDLLLTAHGINYFGLYNSLPDTDPQKPLLRFSARNGGMGVFKDCEFHPVCDSKLPPNQTRASTKAARPNAYEPPVNNSNKPSGSIVSQNASPTITGVSNKSDTEKCEDGNRRSSILEDISDTSSDVEEILVFEVD